MKQTENEFIKFQDLRKSGTATNLIPVHINKMRDETHFWNWNSKVGDWVKGEKMSDVMINSLKNPLVKSNY